MNMLVYESILYKRWYAKPCIKFGVTFDNGQCIDYHCILCAERFACKAWHAYSDKDENVLTDDLARKLCRLCRMCN